MDYIYNKFITHDPLKIYNYSLHFVICYQKKKTLIGRCLDKMIQMFNEQISEIVNICIHDIDNLYYKQYYLYYRDQYLKFISCLLFICKYNEDDSPLIKSNKYIHNSIVQQFYLDKLQLIKKFNECIIFVDKVLNIFNHSPSIKYIVKGNLIVPNQYIDYSNVCEVVEVPDDLVVQDHVHHNVVKDEDDISRLPPKKRYRK